MHHPWLTSRGWAQTTQGPNEQDWMERLLAILACWPVPFPTPVVTTLYATVRATAETAVAYRRMANAEASAWLAQATATRRLIPDFAARYPRSTSLPPAAADWRDGPRAGLAAAVRLLATAAPSAQP
jgi:hypothetical protein